MMMLLSCFAFLHAKWIRYVPRSEILQCVFKWSLHVQQQCIPGYNLCKRTGGLLSLCPACKNLGFGKREAGLGDPLVAISVRQSSS